MVIIERPVTVVLVSAIKSSRVLQLQPESLEQLYSGLLPWSAQSFIGAGELGMSESLSALPYTEVVGLAIFSLIIVAFIVSIWISRWKDRRWTEK